MKFYLSLIFFMIGSLASAQAGGSQVEMADQFRADGKIYVVVATVLIIMAGLFSFLILLERRISKLEKGN